MIKTFTHRSSSQPSDCYSLESNEQAEQENERFYQQLKPSLEQLRREPSNESIAKILAYAKQK